MDQAEIVARNCLNDLDSVLEAKLIVFKALMDELIEQVWVNKLNVERDM